MKFCYCTLPTLRGPECCKYCGIQPLVDKVNYQPKGENYEDHALVISVIDTEPDDSFM